MDLFLQLLDVHGKQLLDRHLALGPGEASEHIISADQAARLASVRIEAGALHGSPGALAAYELDQAAELARGQELNRPFRALAQDQWRRGVDTDGTLDPEVMRCKMRQPDPDVGHTCTLRAGHIGQHEAFNAGDTRLTVATWGTDYTPAAPYTGDRETC